MSHIDDTIARIPEMTFKKRFSWRQKAEAALKKKPDNRDAARLLDALNMFEADEFKSASHKVTGLLAWEKYQRGTATPFCAFHGDRIVGRIIKRATHTVTRKQVYSVEIFGQTLTGPWQNISDAREAGEAAYSKMRSDAPT